MKKYLYILAAAMVPFTGMTSCGDDNDLPEIAVSDRGTVTDDLGNEYEWVKIGDQMWTTTNAKNGTPLSEAEYYNNFDYANVLGSEADVEYYENEYLPEYGNPMTYEDAVASAPEGWRLPTDEDWQKLESYLGMKDAGSKGFRGDGVAFSLMEEGKGPELGLGTGGGCFPVQTYGWIEINLDYVGEHGYYWSSTIDDSYDEDYDMVYFRRITANYGKVSRECMRADCYLSVRWVKDAD